jgi:hypothetical protein
MSLALRLLNKYAVQTQTTNGTDPTAALTALMDRSATRLRPVFESMALIAPFWRAKSARVQADTGMVVAGGRTATFPSYYIVRKIAFHYLTRVMQPLHAMQQAELRTAVAMSVKLGMDHTYRYRLLTHKGVLFDIVFVGF